MIVHGTHCKTILTLTEQVCAIIWTLTDESSHGREFIWQNWKIFFQFYYKFWTASHLVFCSKKHCYPSSKLTFLLCSTWAHSSWRMSTFIPFVDISGSIRRQPFRWIYRSARVSRQQLQMLREINVCDSDPADYRLVFPRQSELWTSHEISLRHWHSLRQSCAKRTRKLAVIWSDIYRWVT